jgi:hypothetical protein
MGHKLQNQAKSNQFCLLERQTTRLNWKCSEEKTMPTENEFAVAIALK